MRKKNEKVLGAIRPNVGLEIIYRKKLDALIDDMAKSTDYWIKVAYRAKSDDIAMDAAGTYSGSATNVMRRVMAKLAEKWQKKFDQAAKDLAIYFTTAVEKRTDAALKTALKKGGISVEFKPTLAMKNAVQSNIQQNVELIQSIPEQYYTQVEGIVMRSIARGRDIGGLGVELQKRYDITIRRASLIARTQNNLASMAMQRARYEELGIKEAIWCHSHGGKEPRPNHVKAGKEKLRYDTQQGAKIDGEYILPGQLINCRCFCKPVIEGFN